MKIIKVIIYFSLICGFAIVPIFSFAVKKSTFTLEQKLKSPLISLLDETVGLHKAFYSKRDDQVHLAVSKMATHISTLEKNTYLFSPTQRSYIHRLLQGLKPKLEAIKAEGTRGGKPHIDSINRTVTYMAHLYGLKKYTIFFCPQDRSVWMQGKTGENRPLHLNSCGAPVGN